MKKVFYALALSLLSSGSMFASLAFSNASGTLAGIPATATSVFQITSTSTQTDLASYASNPFLSGQNGALLNGSQSMATTPAGDSPKISWLSTLPEGFQLNAVAPQPGVTNMGTFSADVNFSFGNGAVNPFSQIPPAFLANGVNGITGNATASSTYAYAFTNYAHDMFDTSAALVPSPEPGTIGLIAAGLASLFLLRKRVR